MSSRYKVRFAAIAIPSSVEPESQTTAGDAFVTDPAATSLLKTTGCGRRRIARSRTGCRECKRRKVKCDEKFPTCGNCQQRGDICRAIAPSRTWQVELPWLYDNALTPLVSPSQDANDHRDVTSLVMPLELSYNHRGINKRTLQYWLEKASQIMVIDPDSNPLSFPILRYINNAPSLIPTIQSVGEAHKHFFESGRLGCCQAERGRALSLIRKELERHLRTPHTVEQMVAMFFSIWIFGMSTAWIDGPATDFGKDHLLGARSLIDILLGLPRPPDTKEESLDAIELAVGAYLWYDMSTALLVDSAQQRQLNSPTMYDAVIRMSGKFHPCYGKCSDLIYFLACLGRYCRTVLEGGAAARDTVLESTFEEQLLRWQPDEESQELGLTSDSFRCLGLINLYTICGRTPGVSNGHFMFRAATNDDTCEGDGVASRVQFVPSTSPPSSTTIEDDSGPAMCEAAFEDHGLCSVDKNAPSEELEGYSIPWGNCDFDFTLNMEEDSDSRPNSSISLDHITDSWDDSDILSIFQATQDLDAPTSPPLSTEATLEGDFDFDQNNSTRSHSTRSVPGQSADETNHLEGRIRYNVLRVLDIVKDIPANHPSNNILGFPLLAASSELRASDIELRDLTSARFRAIYSLNRLPASMLALDLLQEIWALKDGDENTSNMFCSSYLQLMLEKDWVLTFV